MTKEMNKEKENKKVTNKRKINNKTNKMRSNIIN